MAFKEIDVFVTTCVIVFILAISPRCWAESNQSSKRQGESSFSGKSDATDLNSFDAGDFLTVRPVIRESRTLRRIRSIGLYHADHAERLTVSLDESSPIVLDLQLNRDLITDNFFVRHHVNGTEDIWRTEISHSDKPLLPMCHYRGSVRNVSNSWATVSTCSGLSGAVFDGFELYYIEPLNNSLDGYHSWKKHSPELNSAIPLCDEDHHKSLPQSGNHSVKVKRQTTKSGLRESSVGVHNVELVLVVDYAIYRRNNGDMYKILKRVFDIVNVIKEIYSSLQVSIMLVGVVVWSEGDRIHIGKDASHTLSEFKKYCNSHLEVKFHDSAHLMTGVDGRYFGGPVGRAYVGTLCHAHDSCGIAVDDPKSPAAMTASIMSHEMGHNFGMHHDDDSRCQCPLGDCVMAAAIGQPTMHWSSCSRELIHSSSRDAKYNCLRNRPSRCGNMVVDPEEECDCGLPNYCRNQCCDPHTCKFSRRNLKVQCADGACCDLMTCQWEMPGVECRPAENDCDLPEYCFGNSSTCPSDLHKYNGIKCQPRKVCVDKKCSADQSGRNNRPVQCPANCTNGGFCNNLGKCHCPNGFNPPFCQHFGLGGSEDGGPSLDPKVRRLFQIELYVIFLAIVPIVGFLFFVFYIFLNDEQKTFLYKSIRRDGKRFASNLKPVPLIQSPSVDKSVDNPPTEKRNFSNWVKNRVSLTLPNIKIPIVNGPPISILTPASGCSTATITLSALNTPDESLSSTPVAFLQPTTAQDKKQLLLTPPIQRVVRPAPSPPPPPPPSVKKGITNKALEGDVVNRVSSTKNNKFPLPPPSSAKPALL